MQQKANGKKKIHVKNTVKWEGEKKMSQIMQIGSKSWGKKGVYKLLP